MSAIMRTLRTLAAGFRSKRRSGFVLLLGLCVLTIAVSRAIPRMHADAPAPAPPPLACSLNVSSPDETRVVRSFSSTIVCTVTLAGSSDTSFKLAYHLVTPEGATNRFTVTCSGVLHHGAGTCRRTFGVPYAFSPRDSWVEGITLPGGRDLGPVLTVPVLPPVSI
jgi:hypothetical protein